MEATNSDLSKEISSLVSSHLEVSLAYQDLPTGLRARQFLDNVLDCCQMATSFHLTLWKFALFHLPEVCEQAVRNACESGLVLMSLRGDSGLDTFTENWLTQWVNRRGDEESALAVLIDCDMQRLDLVGDILFRLQQVTRPSQVRLFVGFVPSAAPEAPKMDLLHEDDSGFFTRENLAQLPDSYHESGLNE